MKEKKALELALANATLPGVNAVAEAFGVGTNTVRRAAVKVEQIPHLRAEWHETKRRSARDLHDDRIVFLRAAMKDLVRRIPDMSDRDLVGAYKIVSEHHEVARIDGDEYVEEVEHGRLIADASSSEQENPLGDGTSEGRAQETAVEWIVHRASR